jgi:hypothetical protein
MALASIAIQGTNTRRESAIAGTQVLFLDVTIQRNRSDEMMIDDAQIKRMTERFLQWKLPSDFAPDNGISANRPNYAPNVVWEPVGTNLLTYTQAEAMVRFMLDQPPPDGSRQ